MGRYEDEGGRGGIRRPRWTVQATFFGRLPGYWSADRLDTAGAYGTPRQLNSYPISRHFAGSTTWKRGTLHYTASEEKYGLVRILQFRPRILDSMAGFKATESVKCRDVNVLHFIETFQYKSNK